MSDRTRRIIIGTLFYIFIHAEIAFTASQAAKHLISEKVLWQAISFFILPTIVLFCIYIARIIKKEKQGYRALYILLAYIIPGIAVINALTCLAVTVLAKI